MAYDDMLVCLDPTPARGERSRVAIALANIRGARLVGLDVADDAALDERCRDRALKVGRAFEEMTAAVARMRARVATVRTRRGGRSRET